MSESFLNFYTLKVTIEYAYNNGACVPLRVHTVTLKFENKKLIDFKIVMSVQHSPDVSLDKVRQQLIDLVLKEVRTIYPR